MRLPIQLLTWILGIFSHNLPQCFYVHCTAAAVQFLQTCPLSWAAIQAPSISMRVGQLLDFILLHLDVSIMASLPECDSLISSSFWIDVCTIHHMRVGQLLDFILLHILKIFGCINYGFFARIWLFDILFIFNRCLFEPLLNEILQLVRNSHHSSFWHNSLCFISSHSSEMDLTPSEHTSYPDRGRKWSDMYRCVHYCTNSPWILNIPNLNYPAHFLCAYLI